MAEGLASDASGRAVFVAEAGEEGGIRVVIRAGPLQRVVRGGRVAGPEDVGQAGWVALRAH